MNQAKQQAGFSLMEVNMAVFVMAVGILSMVVLYPLGLREGIQGKADLQQSMFADYVLNQIVSAVSKTNFPWSEWKNLDQLQVVAGTTIGKNAYKTELSIPGLWQVKRSGSKVAMEDQHYWIRCEHVDAAQKVLGITVISTDEDLKLSDDQDRLLITNDVYYSEALFMGIP